MTHSKNTQDEVRRFECGHVLLTGGKEAIQEMAEVWDISVEDVYRIGKSARGAIKFVGTRIITNDWGDKEKFKQLDPEKVSYQSSCKHCGEWYYVKVREVQSILTKYSEYFPRNYCMRCKKKYNSQDRRPSASTNEVKDSLKASLGEIVQQHEVN